MVMLVQYMLSMVVHWTSRTCSSRSCMSMTACPFQTSFYMLSSKIGLYYFNCVNTRVYDCSPKSCLHPSQLKRFKTVDVNLLIILFSFKLFSMYLLAQNIFLKRDSRLNIRSRSLRSSSFSRLTCCCEYNHSTIACIQMSNYKKQGK